MRSRRVDCDLMKANVGLGRITDIYEEGSKLSKSLESLLRLAGIWKPQSGKKSCRLMYQGGYWGGPRGLDRPGSVSRGSKGFPGVLKHSLHL